MLVASSRLVMRSRIVVSLKVPLSATSVGHKFGEYDAVLPTVRGSAWINTFKQMVLDPTDPWPVGFGVGDQWHVGQE